MLSGSYQPFAPCCVKALKSSPVGRREKIGVVSVVLTLQTKGQALHHFFSYHLDPHLVTRNAALVIHGKQSVRAMKMYLP